VLAGSGVVGELANGWGVSPAAGGEAESPRLPTPVEQLRAVRRLRRVRARGERGAHRVLILSLRAVFRRTANWARSRRVLGAPPGRSLSRASGRRRWLLAASSRPSFCDGGRGFLLYGVVPLADRALWLQPYSSTDRHFSRRLPRAPTYEPALALHLWRIGRRNGEAFVRPARATCHSPAWPRAHPPGGADHLVDLLAALELTASSIALRPPIYLFFAPFSPCPEEVCPARARRRADTTRASDETSCEIVTRPACRTAITSP